MLKIIDGNTYNVPIPTYYIESDTEIADIPDSSPMGSIAIVNEKNNFHVMMKMADGTWNTL